MPSNEVREMWNDQAAKHIRAKDLQIVRTWPQKFSSALGKRIMKQAVGKVGGEVLDTVVDIVAPEED